MPELGLFHHPTLAATKDALCQEFTSGFHPGADPLEQVLRSSFDRFDSAHHGDFDRWQAAICALPTLRLNQVSFADTVRVAGDCDAETGSTLRQGLLELRPWRKGPFELFQQQIDSEWRSDWKWQRLLSKLPNIIGARVLDVGSGNGYFGWRLLQAGAQAVLGIDPTLLFCMQHLAVNRYICSEQNWVLPLRLEDLPTDDRSSLGFDGTLSMGVIYHRRDPADHVRRLFRCLRPGGWLVLESLVVDAVEPIYPATAGGRYARMGNVWCVPTIELLQSQLQAEGFIDIELIHSGTTQTSEQRSTVWMTFESLQAALDPADSSLTIEGWPRPRRAMLRARRPAAA